MLGMSLPDDEIIPDPDAPRPRIVALRQTCVNCQASWEGRTDDERPVYIRYRHDCLSVRLGPVGGDINSAVDAWPWFESEDFDHADPWTIPIEKVCALTGVVVDCAVEIAG